MKDLFSKRTTWAVLILIALFLWSISRNAAAETVVEVAPGDIFIAGHHQQGQGAILLQERFKDKYSLGIILLIDVNERNRGNTGFQLMRYTRYKKLEVGIGYTFWSDESLAWNATETFALMLGLRLGENWALRLRHWSTGGTSPNNSGLDMITIGRDF